MLSIANAGTAMLTGQRAQLTTQLHGAMLRIDELADKLRNSELQAQRFALRYQTHTAILEAELLAGHSMLSVSEFSGQHSAHEFGLRLAATEQAAQQTIPKHQQLNRATLHEQTAK